MVRKVVIFSFSDKGHKLAEDIASTYVNTILVNHFKQKKLRECVEEFFEQNNLLIFVGAVGIAVRGIAPFICGKDVDPAVLSVDELGQFVIPLLSGHLGGANAHGEDLAKYLGATAVVTTATDINQVFAVDVWAKKEQLWIQNIDHIKYISSALLKGEKVGLITEYAMDKLPEELEQVELAGIQSGVLISEIYRQVFPHTLWVTPKSYVLGIGCRKNIEIDKFEIQLLNFLEEQKIPLDLVGTIASIDLKAEEEAILRFAEKYDIEFLTFKSEVLAQVEGEFHNSDFVKSVTGVDNVCERSAVLASGNKKIRIQKTVLNGMTIAVCKNREMIEKK